MLSDRLAELVEEFRASEDATHRGSWFEAVALELERLMQPGAGVSRETVLECFGPPDLWSANEAGDGVLVYYYDQEPPGRNRDEWCFLFAAGRLTDSGYNRRGINDLSGLRTGGDFPGG